MRDGRKALKACRSPCTLAKRAAMTEQHLAKTFEPAEIEARWYRHWETTGKFRPERTDAAPFTIVNPPPKSVTH